MAELNITIPNDLFARLKADAATRATSVDAVVHALLKGHLTRAECALPGNYEILLQAALGQVSSTPQPGSCILRARTTCSYS